VEAKRQARIQREQDAAAAAAAAKRPVGRPKSKPGPAAPQQLVWVRIVCQPGAPAGKDIALDIGMSAPAPVSKQRSWTAAEKAFALEMLPICGDNLARTIAWLVDNRYSQGEPVNHLGNPGNCCPRVGHE
jgi:hypothetical protein